MQKLDFQFSWILVSDPTCRSPPRTDTGEAHCPCALGHCGLCEELHCVLDPQRAWTAFSWEDPRDQVLVGKSAASFPDEETRIKVLYPVPQPEVPGSVFPGCCGYLLGLLHSLPGCVVYISNTQRSRWRHPGPTCQLLTPAHWSPDPMSLRLTLSRAP